MARFHDIPGDVVILITHQPLDPWGHDSPAQLAARRKVIVALYGTSRYFATVLRPFVRAKLEVIAASHARRAISVIRDHGYGHEVRDVTISCAHWECGEGSDGGQTPARDFTYCSGFAVLIELLGLCPHLACLRIHRLHGRKIDEVSMMRLVAAGNGTLGRLQALELQSPVDDPGLQWPSPIARSVELILRRVPSLKTLWLAGDFGTVDEGGRPNAQPEPIPFALKSLHLRDVRMPCPRFAKWLVKHDEGNVLDHVELGGRAQMANTWIPRCQSLTMRWPSRTDLPPLEALAHMQPAQSENYDDLRILRLDFREAGITADLHWAVGDLVAVQGAVQLQSLRIDFADMGPSICGAMQTELIDIILSHRSLQKLRHLALTAPSDLSDSDRLQRCCDAYGIHLEVFSHSSDELLRAYQQRKATEREIESEQLRDFRARYKYGERFQSQQLGDPVIWELLPRRSTTWSESLWRVVLQAFWIIQYTITGPMILFARLLSSGGRSADTSSNSIHNPQESDL